MWASEKSLIVMNMTEKEIRWITLKHIHDNFLKYKKELQTV